jgi:hypothetical protein
MFRTLSGWPALAVVLVTIGLLVIRQTGSTVGGWNASRCRRWDIATAPLIVGVLVLAVLRVVILSR